MDLFSLAGRTALVTGASRGLGRAIALAMAEAGARVVLAARDEAKLNEVAALIGDKGGEAEIVTFELGDLPAVERVIPGLTDRGLADPEDKLSHTVKLAWRALALLQLECEANGAPMARGARNG